MNGPVQQTVVIAHDMGEQLLHGFIGAALAPGGDETTDCDSEPDRLSGSFESTPYRAHRTFIRGGDS